MEHNKLKRGQELELTISDIAFGGQGIAKLDNLIFFVNYGVYSNFIDLFKGHSSLA